MWINRIILIFASRINQNIKTYNEIYPPHWPNRLILSLLAILLGVAVPASAYNVTQGNLRFTTQSSGTASVSGYVSGITEANIPSSIVYNDVEYIVTSIGSEVFYNCQSLTSVYVPNTVTSIGTYAFYNCSNLSTLSLGNSVNSIGASAFRGCSAITAITIPGSVTSIGIDAFTDCISLASLILADSPEILDLCRYQCSVDALWGGCPLASIYLGRNLNYATAPFPIGEALNHITIGETVTSLGNALFKDSKTLTTITIPNNVTQLGSNLFEGCSALSSVTLPSSLLVLGSGVFKECSALSSIQLPNTLTTIDAEAFSGCSALTSLTIPSSVKSIGNSAFDGCLALSSLILAEPEEIDTTSQEHQYTESFEDWQSTNKSHGSTSSHAYTMNVYAGDVLSFDYLVSSESNYDILYVTLNDSRIISVSGSVSSTFTTTFEEDQMVTILASYSKDGSNSYGNDLGQITNVTLQHNCLGDHFLKIGYGISSDGAGQPLFADSPLQSLNLGRNIGYAYNYNQYASPFSGQTQLATVNISNKVSSLPPYIFYNCQSIEDVAIPSSIISIGRSAFDTTKLSSLTIPSSVTSIESMAFANCEALGEITIEDGDEALNLAADIFSHSPLQRITLGRQLSYDNSPFAGMESLESVDLTDATLCITADMFSNCSGLTSITLPSGLTEIQNNAFAGCTNLNEIILSSGAHPTLADNAFDLSTKADATLLMNDITDAKSILNDDTWNTFSNIGLLKDDRNYALLMCDVALNALASVADAECVYALPLDTENTVSSQHECVAYHHNEEITDAINSDGGYSFTPSMSWALNRINAYSFNGDDTRTVTLTKAGELFNTLGMSNLQNIRSLTISGPINGTDVMTINRMSALENLNLKAADIVEGGVTYRDEYKTIDNVVGSYFFYNVENLKMLILPESATSISESAMQNCSNLEQIVLGNNITSLEADAFKGCSKLSSLVIPSSVNRIGNGAFNDCKSLRELTIADHVCDEGVSLDHGSQRFDDWTSTNHDSNSSSTVVYEINAGEGDVISFNYWVSSESNYDYLNIMINGERVISISGTYSDAYSYFYTVPTSGIVTITATYSKDGSTSHGSDVGSIFDVALTCNHLAHHTQTLSLGYGTYDYDAGKGMFADCPLEKVYIGRNLGYPQSGNYGTNLSDYGYSPFYDKRQLKEVTIGEDVTALGQYFFANCTSLASLDIPANVTEISRCAFNGCTALTNLNIADSETALTLGYNTYNSYGSGKGLFADCPLRSLHLGRDIEYSSSNYEYPSYYGYSAFYGRELLSDLTFGDDVTSIGAFAFKGCKNINSLTLPASLTFLGHSAFSGCEAVESVFIPEGIDYVRSKTFENCFGLQELTLGSGVAEISDDAFANCSDIQHIKSYNTTPPKINHAVFASVDKEACMLQVRKGSLVYYYLDPVWREFMNMAENLFALSPLPTAKYGDAPIDLRQYAPAELDLIYETTNSDVITIDGTIMTVIGAGEATVSAKPAEEGTDMELISVLRQFTIEKADLKVCAPVLNVTVGEALPEMTMTYEGFVYDDTAEDIELLPEMLCEAVDTSVAGVYPIRLRGGSDRNYNFDLQDGVLTVETRKITLSPLPEFRYGDDTFNLSTLLPEADAEISIRYAVENPDVATVDGSILTITGAGETVISAWSDDPAVELTNSERIISVSRASLTLYAPMINILQNEEIPDVVITAEGFVGNDCLEDLLEQPVIECYADPYTMGEYEILFIYSGYHPSYDITTVDGKITVLDPNETSIDVTACDSLKIESGIGRVDISGIAEDTLVILTDTNGHEIARAAASGEGTVAFDQISSGIHIVIIPAMKHAKKIMVR